MNCQQTVNVSSMPNTFMSVDTAQFCLFKNLMNCLLSMNKSPCQCVFCTVTNMANFHVKKYLELIQYFSF